MFCSMKKILVMAAVCGLPFSAQAASLFVTDTGSSSADCSESAPCDLRTAIGNAAAGDDIKIAAGNYSFSSTLTISKSLNVIGDSQEGVVLTCAKLTSCFQVSLPASSQTSFKNLTLTNSSSGIRVTSTSAGSVSVDSVTFENTDHGIYQDGKNATLAVVHESDFSGQKAAGIYVTAGTVGVIHRNNFNGDGQEEQVGIKLEASQLDKVKINYNTFTGFNDEIDNSYALFVSESLSDATVRGNVFTGNDFGIYLIPSTGTSTVRIVDNQFTSHLNAVSVVGHFDGKITANTIDKSESALYFYQSQGNAKIENNLITAAVVGVSLTDSTHQIIHNTIVGDVDSTGFAALYASGAQTEAAVYKNIFYGYYHGVSQSKGAVVTLGLNINSNHFDVEVYGTVVDLGGNLSADPGFADLANGDYSLTDSSLARIEGSSSYVKLKYDKAQYESKSYYDGEDVEGGSYKKRVYNSIGCYD